ncbi:MAG: outer membrane protein assembly factor BamC [Agarilytica sp.]
MIIRFSSTFVKAFLLISLFQLSACSTLYGERGVFRGKSKDYLRSGELAPIKVPADLQGRELISLYEVAPIAPNDEFGDSVVLGEYEVPRPKAINTEKGEVGVKIQRLGERKWIFLSASTSQVWPRTQNFLSQAGFQALQSDPVKGLIETTDVVFKDDESKKYRFRVSIEKGIHPETTEIHIKEVSFAKDELVGGQTAWKSNISDGSRSEALLNELAGALVRNINNSAASLLGQNVGGDAKVDFVTSGSEPTMRLRLYPERAAATLAHALEREDFVFWEEAANYGIFYVAIRPEKTGFFGSWSQKKVPEKPKHSLVDVLQHLSDKPDVKTTFGHVEGAKYGEPLNKSQGLLVLMSNEGEAMHVVVRNVRGERLPKEEAKEVLRIVRKNLI